MESITRIKNVNIDIILWTDQNDKYGHYFVDGGNSFNKYYFIYAILLYFFKKFALATSGSVAALEPFTAGPIS